MRKIGSKLEASLSVMDREASSFLSSVRLPWVTLAIVLSSLILSLSNSLSVQAELKLPLQITAWISPLTLITAHFTHWGINHLCWDAGTFLFLGLVLENCLIKSRSLAWYLQIAAASISFSLILLPQEFSSYRGLSGLCVSLWALISCILWQQGEKLRSGLLFAALIAKVVAEILRSTTLFALGSVEGYQVAWQAHLVGGMVTILSFLFVRNPTSETNVGRLRALKKSGGHAFLKDSP